ncbi:MAG: hypothetical protein Q8O16_00260 [Dehalococcoidia bacterium]|nr:hypothetical protein [Dehalococcoidia bacterium]
MAFAASLTSRWVSSDFSDTILGNAATKRAPEFTRHWRGTRWKLETDSLLAVMAIEINNKPRT